MDQVVSSYTSTIRSLRHAKAEISTSDEVKFLIAAVTRRELMTAETEAKIVRKMIVANGAREDDVVLLKKISKQTLSEALPNYNVEHFVCHAKANINPSESCLILTLGERFTLSELARVKFQAGALAFLSACSTSIGQEGPWQDEGLTLTNAFQVAGFARVVGTMWDAEALASMEIAERFYRLMQNDLTRSPKALHEAVKEVRYLKLDEPSRWAPYIYAGR